MKKIILATLLVSLTVSMMAFELKPLSGDRNDVFYYRSEPSDIYGRFMAVVPVFVVYPDGRMSLEQAQDYMHDTGLDELVRMSDGAVYIINPLAETYDAVKDLAYYNEFIAGQFLVTNLKILGFGKGADFVNGTLSRQAGNVAGIVSVGGKASISGNVLRESPVPVYVAGNNAGRTALSYISLNDAVKVSETSSYLSIYENEDEKLLRVVVDERKDVGVGEYLRTAWDELLSRNYRYNNYCHTWYTGDYDMRYGDYELVPYVDYDRMKLVRNVVLKSNDAGKDFLWYEYLPEELSQLPECSVPMVVLLHGNGNDPRTQAETSGFLSVAEKERIVVVEMEWQGSEEYGALGMDGVETAVYDILRKYPQIDRSRIYAEGLSAGAIMATATGVRKSYIFAAVGAQSGGVMNHRAFAPSRESLENEALQKRGKVIMPYFSIMCLDDEVVHRVTEENHADNSFFNAWKLYGKMNGATVAEMPDFSIDPVFGISLNDRREIRNMKNVDVHVGDVNVDGRPVLRLVAVEEYGHWNFQPATWMMWDYFKLWSRDPLTGESIYHGQKIG